MLLDNIGAYLAANSVGTVGSTIFLGDMPEMPNDLIALFEYAGDPPDDTHDGKHYENPGLQVRVRGVSYSTVRAKIADIENLLHTLANRHLSGTRYLFIRAVQSPFPIGRDQQKRVELVQNFIVTKVR